MLHPSQEEFRELARAYRVVPVWREVLADLTTPVAAFARVVGSGDGFLLESVEHGERWSRWSFIGRNPMATLVAQGRHVEVTGHLGVNIPRHEGMLAALEVLLDHYQAPSIEGLPPLHGGLVGYLGYDIVREVEHLPDVPADDSGHPDAVMSLIGELAVYDHWRQRATLISNVLVPEGADDRTIDRLYYEAVLRVEAIAADGAKPLDEPLVAPPEPFDAGGSEPVETSSTMGLELYSQAVEAAREYIFAGDVFQVVLAQRFDFELGADAFDAYRVLRQVNPSPYMYFLRHGDLEVVGGSPEPMVKLLDGKVISRPIAGTRRRGRTDAEDRRLAAELSEHPKEVAEHVMLVDLARNDVGRGGGVRNPEPRRDDDPRAVQPRHAPHLAGLGEAEPVGHADRRAAGHPARGHGVGRAQGEGHGDHRRAGAHQAGPVRGRGRLHRLLGQHRHRHHHPHHAGAQRPGLGAGRSGDRRRLGARRGARRVREQGPGAAGRDPRGQAHDRSPQAGRPHPMTAAAALLARDVVRVSGADAAAYLQGQISQDVDAVEVGASAWSLVLAPQGKVDAWFRLTRLGGNEFLIDLDAGFAGALVARLERFKLRVDAAFEILEGWQMLSIRGSGGAPDGLEAVGAELRVPVAWPGFEGVDLLGPEVSLPVGVVDSPAAMEVARIRAGWPAMGRELTERTIPAEVAGLVESSVSFTKGCYTGQELVARIDSRGGNVPRPVRLLEIRGEVSPGAGITVDGKAVGEVTSAAEDPASGVTVALGPVHRRVEPPADAEADGVAATVLPTPASTELMPAEDI